MAAGVCEELLRANVQLPILGVCMGMQALAVANGACIQHAPEPIHGRLSQIHHTGHRLFKGIPSGHHMLYLCVTVAPHLVCMPHLQSAAATSQSYGFVHLLAHVCSQAKSPRTIAAVVSHLRS